MSASRKILISLVFVLFLAMIPAANYALHHIGIGCTINPPCVIAVWYKPLIYAPSGVLFAGFAFVLRDILQRLTGLSTSLIAVILGTLLSYLYVDPQIATAGCLAYFLSEIADTICYSYIQRYNLILAVIVSATVGLVIDSVVFLQMAFHSYQFLPGQIIGKLWTVILAIPLIKLCRNNLRLNTES